jgi:hypothetical protein
MNEHKTRRRFLSLTKKQLGDFGETLWANIFAASGIQYIPLHKIETGGAPMLEGGQRSVLPDFDCVLDGRSIYIDSKVKTQSIIFRRLSQERHGINRSHWIDYLKAAAASGKMCGLGVVELFRDGPSVEWSGSLLIETLGNLGIPFDGFSTDKHKVYWPRKSFCNLGSFTACELVAIRRGELKAAYPVELSRIFIATPQRLRQTSLWN